MSETTTTPTLPKWSLAVPPAAVLVLALSWGRDLGTILLVLVCLGVAGAVVGAVHHAEVVAHRVGEPFGTLILAVAVTVIEVALIVTLMASSEEGKAASLARDTVFAAIMITCNGIVGLALLVGSLRHRVQEFRAHASSGALGVIAALVTLSLVVPAFTTSSPGPTFSGVQLAFAGVVSLVLYGTFVFVQTIRHRDYFLPKNSTTDEDHADAPTNRTAYTSLGLLLVCLVAVVGLAKTVSPTLEAGVDAIGAPVSFVGVVIALLVLAPETAAAVRAALRDRLQVSLNLALGSALASIGLTIPAIAIASIFLTGPLVLGLDPKELVLLALTMVVSTLTLVQGRATLLQGVLHLTLFSSFVFLAIMP
ncbi:calcium:proton antiporter [Actinokineospora sp. G85]|uniref:calcium:proton antiporter n=1 Tax=Actinokineospora sp. G85 TaxID=3406626 RepID=UPI003C76F970